MANPWFKFWGGEYLGDPKMDAFDGNERSCWLTILSLASQSEDGWVLYTSEEKLLEKSGIKTVERPIYSGIMIKFEKFNMIQFRNGDVTQGFKPINWEKRQYSEGYSRVKRFRERNSNENETADITTEQNRTDKNRIDILFDQFWNLYPRKVSKKKTYIVFKSIKLTEEMAAQIMDALQKHMGSEQWKTPKFIPHPTTWLNQERWNDEVLKAEKKPYYNGKQMKKVNDAWKVWDRGQWNEYGDKESKIEWK